MSGMTDHDKDVETLRHMIEDAERIVAFTGAGISTESGIPDFRSPGGVWTKYQPIEFPDFLASEEMRRESWRRRFATQSEIGEVEPNRGHRAIAKLAEIGNVANVVTQNVDGLHQRSGVPDGKIVELHGNATYARCLECYERYELEPIRAAFEADGALPECGACGGIIKTATISFGQQMPEAEMHRAEAATLRCDLFIAIGSSLRVYPAAGFPSLAKRNGALLAIVNREATGLDVEADLLVHAEIGPTLGEVVGVD